MVLKGREYLSNIEIGWQRKRIRLMDGTILGWETDSDDDDLHCYLNLIGSLEGLNQHLRTNNWL